VSQRDYYPLGDEAWQGTLLKVREAPLPLPVMAEGVPLVMPVLQRGGLSVRDA
jgi:hypothetical protein